MQYIAWVFGFFGFLAFLELSELKSELKSRVTELERQLSAMKGTTFHEDRQALLKAAGAYIGQQIILDLKEEHMDPDVVMYGNTKHGSVTVLDADNEWMLVRIDTPKGIKEKLIRMESVDRISTLREQTE